MTILRSTTSVVVAAAVLVACTSATYRQVSTMPSSGPPDNGKAVIVLAGDFRETTPLRSDIPLSGKVFFRKIDEGYSHRAPDDYDFAFERSVGFTASFGGTDEYRHPYLFQIEPGTYVIEKLQTGRAPFTVGPGYSPQTKRAAFGSFSVRAGEVVNLGQLIVYMWWYQGNFTARVEDNTAEVRSYLSSSYPGLEPKLQPHLLDVRPSFRFSMS